MKKLLMAMAILAVGTTAFGVDQTADAPVRVRAELVSQNLVISDIDGRPILLDFQKISKSEAGPRHAFVDFKVEATSQITGVNNMKFVLGQSDSAATSDDVTLTNIDATKTSNNTMIAKLKLDSYEGATGTLAKGTIHTGRINGTLTNSEWNTKEAGVYEGQTELKVTVTTN